MSNNPFSCGTQFGDWTIANCDRCTKGQATEDDAPACEIALALLDAYVGDGTISPEITARLNPQPDRYCWPCGEWEASEEWKAKMERARMVQMDGLEVREWYGQCPVQVEGKIDGFPFYLRLRGDISFYVASTPDGKPLDAPHFALTSDTHPSIDKVDYDRYPGYATDEETAACLHECVRIYRERKG